MCKDIDIFRIEIGSLNYLMFFLQICSCGLHNGIDYQGFYRSYQIITLISGKRISR